MCKRRTSPAGCSRRIMNPQPLTTAEQALLDAARHGVPVAFLERTGTRVDVGQWFRWPRLWVALAGEQLILFATGKRSYVETLPVREAQSSLYNAITGEVLLAPADELRARALRLPPVAGRHLLALIQEKEMTHA